MTKGDRALKHMSSRCGLLLGVRTMTYLFGAIMSESNGVDLFIMRGGGGLKRNIWID